MRLVIRALRHFNSDPHFQFDLHLVGTGFWLLNFVLIAVCYFADKSLWDRASIFYLAIITFYGNFSTDYCGVSDSEASGHTAALRGVRQTAVHHRFVGRILDRTTVDPHFQWKIHLALAYAWLFQMILAVVLFIWVPTFWNSGLGLFYVLAVNLYTCLATDYSALPGALAANNAQQLRGGHSPWEQ